MKDTMERFDFAKMLFSFNYSMKKIFNVGESPFQLDDNQNFLTFEISNF